jgi:hypothetical protein
VLRPGGRAAISDIVADRDVPERLRRDPELWSGCIAGAYREDRFLEAFAAAGFHGIHIARRDAEPWRVLDGIQFLAVTVLAYKGGTAAAGEGERHVLYRGPLRSVQDDQGHVFQRGVATVVAESTWRRLQTEPYAGMFEAVGDAVAQGPERAVDTAQPKSCCGPQQHC